MNRYYLTGAPCPESPDGDHLQNISGDCGLCGTRVMRRHRVRVVHPSVRAAEMSQARCSGHESMCPRHAPAIYAAWQSRHRA